MISKLKKEHILYESFANKTNDRDSIISFHDYFSFILKEGIELCAHLNESMEERIDNKKKLDDLYFEIIKLVKSDLENIEALIKKEKLEEDFALTDSIGSIKSLINGTTGITGGDIVDHIRDDFVDLVRRLHTLGYSKEISKYVELDKDSKLNTDKIFAFKDFKLYINQKNNFNKKDVRSIAGAFIRLASLYMKIQKSEDSNSEPIEIPNWVQQLNEKMLDHEYSNLLSGKITEGRHFNRKNYSSDMERFHQSIITSNQEEDTEDKKEVFYLDGENIFHHKIGKMLYKKKGLEDPKYIIIFKKIIQYMPANTNRIRIKEFEKISNNGSKPNDDYRANIGKSAKSFNSFLKKNGVQNVNPKTKEMVIGATDEYIIFNNIL